MRQFISRHLGQAAWPPAVAAGLGCALPLSLGMFSGHAGFYWATVGAFMGSLANPILRLGMLSMLTLVLLGAFSVAIGYRVAISPWLSFALFAFYGLLLAALRRYGSEAARGGLALAICLCLGQGEFGLGNFDRPPAIAMLFLLGGLWMSLLGFGLRGAAGLRMWPEQPRLATARRGMRRMARHHPLSHWWPAAVASALALGLAGFCASYLALPRSYWLTLPVLLTIPLAHRYGFLKALLADLLLLMLFVLLILLGYSLAGAPPVAFFTLALVVLFRAYQARRYGVFALQITLCFLLLTETLSFDWTEPQWRLINAVVGTCVAVLSALLLHLCRRLHRKRGRDSDPAPAQSAPPQPQDPVGQSHFV
ncbi:FUSC family protein [Stutzerimonas tarimensis]|uniref:FUSC family protein n=1 Tax=Stutzerimonas tarimensis TaxID=1507735 RepID=A0ABV7T473_9GAMM